MRTVEEDRFHSFGGIWVIKHIEYDSHVGKRIARTEENIYGWEKNIVSSKIDFRNPIVLCLGGAGIDDDKSANGFAKLTQGLLGRTGFNNSEIQLLSASYPKDVQKLSEERIKFSRNEPREREDYIFNIYDLLFSPIIKMYMQDPVNGLKSMKSSLRNITLFSHCHGSFVACELINYFKEDIKKISQMLDVPVPDLNDLTSEITSIMLSPRDGVQNCYGPLNIGFTMASDNLGGGVRKPVCKDTNISISTFCNNLIRNKIEGSENFYHKYNTLHNFWDTDRFGADITFIEDKYSDYGMQGQGSSDMIYQNIFMGNYFHLVENYCSLNAKLDEDGVGILMKNEKGRNFTNILAKALQNAVSLSCMGAKRTLEEVISNDTELAYIQGSAANNPDFKNVQFNGSLEEFQFNYALKNTLDNKGKTVTKIVECKRITGR